MPIINTIGSGTVPLLSLDNSIGKKTRWRTAFLRIFTERVDRPFEKVNRLIRANGGNGGGEKEGRLARSTNAPPFQINSLNTSGITSFSTGVSM
jgi:hypothetical protein